MDSMDTPNSNDRDEIGRSLEVMNQSGFPTRRMDRLPAGYTEEAPSFSSGEIRIDPLRILWGIWRHKRIVMAVAVACVVLAIIVTLMMTPYYRATATLQIDRDSVNIVKVDGFDPSQTGEDRSFLQTQYKLLQSRSLAEHVSIRLGLMDDEAFLPKQATGLFVSLRNLFSQPDDEASEQKQMVRRQSAILTVLANGLTVRGVPNSKIVEVSFDHSNPEVARRVADAFARTFITDNLDRKYASSSYARTFLEERLQQLKVRLEENEKELRDYAEEYQIVRLDNEDSLISAKLGAMNENLSKAKDETIRLEAIWKEAENSSGLNLSKVQENKVIQDIRIRRDDLASQYQEKLNIFKPGFPEMVQMKARIDEFDRAIQQQIKNIKESIRKDYLAALAREEGVRQEIASLEESLNDQRKKAIKYNILKREVDTSKTLYEGLLQRYKEIGVAGGVGTNNISLIDAPIFPDRPRTPNLTLNLALGMIIGLLVGIGAAIAIDSLDTRFKIPDEVEAALGIPILGVIPKASREGYEEALADPRSGIAEAYRSLRTSIQFSTSRGTPKSIYVTSSKQGEGKSTTSLVLATKFTQLGSRVLLIDSDMRKPSMHRKMSVPNESGLSNFLIGNMKFSDLVQKTDNPALDVITAGPIPPNPAELLASSRTVDLLRIGGEEYDLIVFDGPPLLGLADSVIMNSLVDSTIIVVAANDCRKNVAIGALRRLQGGRNRVIGAVFTKYDATQSGYGYGYGYGYGDYYAYGSDDPKSITHSHTTDAT